MSTDEAVEALLRQELGVDAQVDQDFRPPDYPVTIGTGEDAEVVQPGDITDHLIDLDGQRGLLDQKVHSR